MLLPPRVSLILNVITKLASQELKCPQRLLPFFKGGHLEHMQTSYKGGGGVAFIPPGHLHYEKPLYLKWFISLQWSDLPQ